jgi:hypothetical protein
MSWKEKCKEEREQVFKLQMKVIEQRKTIRKLKRELGGEEE